MQITINQAQIEQAIREYVNRKVRIDDSQRLEIDLKATRGEDGYTAVIEIVDVTDDAGAVEQLVPVQPSTVTSAPATITAAAAQATPVRTRRTAPKQVQAQTIDDVQEETQALAGEQDSMAAAEDTAAAPEAADEAPEAGTGTADEAPAEEAPRRPSLFGNLTKPVNGPKTDA